MERRRRRCRRLAGSGTSPSRVTRATRLSLLENQDTHVQYNMRKVVMRTVVETCTEGRVPNH